MNKLNDLKVLIDILQKASALIANDTTISNANIHDLNKYEIGEYINQAANKLQDSQNNSDNIRKIANYVISEILTTD